MPIFGQADGTIFKQAVRLELCGVALIDIAGQVWYNYTCDYLLKGSDPMSVLVSVVMPTYNCAKYIAQSIDSVIHQTLTDWELCIVDDASTDNTRQVVKKYLMVHPNIHYKRLQKNSGPAAARNKAISMAKGKYIAFLDSDDLWDSQKLEKQVEFMRNNNAAFSCTGYRLISEKGGDLNTAFIPPKNIDYRRCVSLSNPIGNLTAMYDRELLGTVMVPQIKKRNDFALWLQILKKTPVCYGMDDVLGSYRTGRDDSVSKNKLKQMKYHWQLYRRIEKHNVLRSTYEMGCWAFVKGTGVGLKKIRPHSRRE